MKMLMFDFRDSEKDFFNTNELKDFDIEFINEPLNEFSYLSEKQLNETDIISVFITSNLTEHILKKFKNLRIITTRSTGFDHIDLKYCTQNNIAVFNVGTYGEKSVAQFTFMLILALLRKLIPSYLDLQKKIIEHSSYEGRNLDSLKLGILGCGAIGSSVAKIAHYFNMKIYVYSFEKNPEIKEFVNYCTFDEVIKNADIISLHLPYNTDNYHIINEEIIKKMKKGVLIINTARGELIDIIALYNNIVTGQIGGVALDTVECEKIIINDNKISPSYDLSNCTTKALAIQKMLNMPNVIITPHIAYNTKESTETLLKETFHNIRDFTKGLHTNQLR